MKDIYLSYTNQNFHIAQHLKEDVEASTNLTVALENDDWEEEGEDCSGDFQEHLMDAKMCLVLNTMSGNITAWIMDPDITQVQPGFTRPRDIDLPPQIDFTESYEKGIDIFRYILKILTGSGDIEMEPDHEKYAVKEERTVSSRIVPAESKKSPKLASPYKRAAKNLNRMMRKLHCVYCPSGVIEW
eukprot:CAMPEP_0113605230 /NCGR_PEP_ID=MMETSP0017_2-20120614/2217_1 /TAXON_ID=2856 /ORGANISM="Cylindrotheca closterium" /LENGTH=185 /DNA_ID=CAMNT_0000513707 /DNA_START=38 /DNA_END=592 /DNA_ORIENTATION=+ /assembly_acc=CAM_ASM_000147